MAKLSLKGPVGTNPVSNVPNARKVWPDLSKREDFQEAESRHVWY